MKKQLITVLFLSALTGVANAADPGFFFPGGARQDSVIHAPNTSLDGKTVTQWGAAIDANSTTSANAVPKTWIGANTTSSVTGVAGLDSAGNVTAPVVGDVSAAKATATGSTFSRSLSTRAVDTINVKDFGATGDGSTDDTVAVTAAYTKANALLASGSSVTILYPRGTYVLGSVPVISVPDGLTAGIVGGAGNSILKLTTTTSPLSIHDASTDGKSGHAFSANFTIIPQVSGGNGAEIVATPRASGGSGFAPSIHDIRCVNTKGGSTLYSCVKLSDVSNASVRDVSNTGLSDGTGLSSQGTDVWIYTTPDPSGGTNYSVDNNFYSLSQVGGFALLRTDNHVEGVHITDATNLASSYGVYSPTRIGGGGLLWLSITSSHLNDYIAGAYVENGSDIKIVNSLLYSTGSYTPASSAILPVNYSTVKGMLSGASSAWGGLWCVNCGSSSVSSSDFYGFLRSDQASIGIGFYNSALTDSTGATIASPTYEWGNSVSGNSVQATEVCGIYISSIYGKMTVGGNTLNTTGGSNSSCIKSTAITAYGNVQDSSASDVSVINNILHVAATNAWFSGNVNFSLNSSCSIAGAQGLGTCWNHSAGAEVDFIDTIGSSANGGFDFYTASSGGSIQQAAGSAILSVRTNGITARGPVAVTGILNVDSNLNAKGTTSLDSGKITTNGVGQLSINSPNSTSLSLRGEADLANSKFTDPDPNVSRDAKFGEKGIAVSGGTKTDALDVTGGADISGNLSTSSITASGSITGTDLIATDATTPTSSTACKQGEMHSDDNYLYVCTSGLTYKKVALSGLN